MTPGEFIDLFAISIIKLTKSSSEFVKTETNQRLIEFYDEYEILLEQSAQAEINKKFFDLLKIHSQLWDLESKVRRPDVVDNINANLFYVTAMKIFDLNLTRAEIKRDIDKQFGYQSISKEYRTDDSEEN